MTSQLVENVERWPLDRLVPHARNARTHSEDQIAQIAGSIAEFGFVNPVLVGDDGVIVAGHGCVLAARKLGLAEAPVIVLSHLAPSRRSDGPRGDRRPALGSEAAFLDLGAPTGLTRASRSLSSPARTAATKLSISAGSLSFEATAMPALEEAFARVKLA